MIHAKQHRESTKPQSEVHIKTGGNHRKMLYPPSREQASEEVADTHEAFKSKKKHRFNTSGANTRNTQIKCNKGPNPSETNFTIPFLRSLMLRICERASIDGTMNTPSSSPSGKRHLRRSANCILKRTHNSFRSLSLQLIWIDGK